MCRYLVQCDTLGGGQQLVVQLRCRSWSSTLKELRRSVGGGEQDEEETAALRKNSETQEEQSGARQQGHETGLDGWTHLSWRAELYRNLTHQAHT